MTKDEKEHRLQIRKALKEAIEQGLVIEIKKDVFELTEKGRALQKKKKH